jgi:hypothetical protein
MPRLKHYFALAALVLTVACNRAGTPEPTQPSTPTRDASADGIWERTTQEIIGFEKSVVKVKPRAYTSFLLKPAALEDVLKRAPMEFQSHDQPPAVLTLPRPDGSYSRFEIVESPIMEPALAKRFPAIKNYRGKGLDDQSAVVRFEKTRLGLHAMVLSASGAFFVDGIGKGEGALYVSYSKSSLPADPDEFACLHIFKPSDDYQRDRETTLSPPSPTPRPMPQATPQSWSPGVLRTYRLAVAATHRYVEAIQSLRDPSEPEVDALEGALIAINRTIDRVNLIFENDVGIRLLLVNDEPNIIHVDAANDPYDEGEQDQKLRELNQAQLTEHIGDANYDVGHLFLAPPKAFGGSAQPSACSPFFKAWGLTGSPHPTGNAFDVQYVAHEIAHQFGASHSFDGNTKGCEDNRNSETAYEPGSGSTIMGYSSATLICGPETIQDTADPYFHAISLEEIRAFVTNTTDEGGNFCAQKLETGNRFAPQVNAGSDFKVPSQTPFALTVESSSDGDGDPLTFTWEEFDRGPRKPHPEIPGDDMKKRPLFRSRPGSTATIRILPAMNFIMNPPTIYVAEVLPAKTRTMKFRVTARDGRGLYGFDETSIKVVSGRQSAPVGPFAVSNPGAGAVWRRGSTQSINWSVARTDLTQINCTRVRILFVVRGDEGHPIVLAADVPNNGTAQVTLPNDLPLTTMGRIKIEAIGNIFFAVSNSDIQIVEP